MIPCSSWLRMLRSDLQGMDMNDPPGAAERPLAIRTAACGGPTHPYRAEIRTANSAAAMGGSKGMSKPEAPGLARVAGPEPDVVARRQKPPFESAGSARLAWSSTRS